ncbi:glycosidase crf1 [Tolypocladium capitatum]|uniref:chitinase n=1 Tax=Tolypocladium capitatum TaxID=45235 RepID=A0A2K3QLV8_9HYPO|nr:glycosidase crf1 [Tolypocladium capitatum]
MLYRSLLAAASLLGLAAAQVHTDCNPMQKDCPADPAFGTDHVFQFNSTPSSNLWETTAGTVQYDANNGAAFTIKKQGDSPTIRTKFYFFFGRTEIWLKVAGGRGIVSSVMWLSDDLDEVDWEFLGSNKSFASTNYFGKGLQDFRNGGMHPMSGMQDDFHNYTTVWTKQQIDWFIDGNHVRTLLANDANNTLNYPQTPMRMSIGIWAGGDPSLPEGTRQWAGGDTDYAAGPYTMRVQKAQVTDFSSGKEYSFGDRSGSWQSIKIAGGNSTAFEALNQVPEKSIGQKWDALPGGAKVGVYAGGGAVAAIAVSTLLYYLIRQRRLGAKEAKAAGDRAEAERLEMEQFKKQGIDPDGFAEHGQEYDAREMHSSGMSDADSYHVPETIPADPLSSWGAGAGVGVAAGAAAAMRPAQSPRSPAPSSHRDNHGPGGPRGFDFGVPPSPMVRSQSPMMRSQSPGMPPQGPLPSPRGQMRSDSAPNAYSRMGSPGPQGGYGPARMQSPGPMGPPRSFTDNYQQGYRGNQGGYR